MKGERWKRFEQQGIKPYDQHQYDLVTKSRKDELGTQKSSSTIDRKSSLIQLMRIKIQMN